VVSIGAPWKESAINAPETAAKLPRPGLTDGNSGEFLVMTKLVPGGADGIRAWHAKRVADPSKEAETRAALREIGTLHDSRQVIFDNDTRFIFASVFDGSWDKYIDDFATTSIGTAFDELFSFSEGFPGIKDPDVKEWFVAHQVPATIFLSAYPDLTTQQIWKDQRVNAAFQAVLDTPEFRAMIENPANAALVATPAFQQLLEESES